MPKLIAEPKEDTIAYRQPVIDYYVENYLRIEAEELTKISGRNVIGFLLELQQLSKTDFTVMNSFYLRILKHYKDGRIN